MQAHIIDGTHVQTGKTRADAFRLIFPACGMRSVVHLFSGEDEQSPSGLRPWPGGNSMIQTIAPHIGGKTATLRWGASEALMKPQGEIESAICEGISRYQHEYMGRGPKDVRAHLIGD